MINKMVFEDGILVKYNKSFNVDLIPKSNRTSRPQNKLIPRHITIHNTGNKGASAKANSDYVDNATGYVSWHFTIGNGIVFQELPITENAWAAGDGSKGEGNRKSIHLEIAEVPGAYETAVQFIKDLMNYLDFTTDNIYPHKHWSGKQCPRLILPKWDKFIEELKESEFPKWQEDLISWGMEVGLIKDYHKPNEVIEMWTLLAILKNDEERERL